MRFTQGLVLGAGVALVVVISLPRSRPPEPTRQPDAAPIVTPEPKTLPVQTPQSAQTADQGPVRQAWDAKPLRTADFVALRVARNEKAVIERLSKLRDPRAGELEGHGYVFHTFRENGRWSCWANPSDEGRTGCRSFFVAKGGAILVADGSREPYATTKPSGNWKPLR